MTVLQSQRRRSTVRRGRSALLTVTTSLLAATLLATPAAAVVIPPLDSFQLVSKDPADQTPHARNGEVRAFAEIGNVVYVGGTFTQVKSPTDTTWTTQRYLFAYDRTTGAISSSFLPDLDGAVNGLAVSPNGYLIVGGAFRNVNGVARRNLVALDPATGQIVSSWVGRSDGGNIRDMALHGNWLYIGGAFNWINGTPHTGVARLNASTGDVDPTFVVNATVGRHGTSSYVWTLDISPDGTTLVIGGNFREVNGLPREQIALIDVSTNPATVLDWSTQKFAPPCVATTFTHYVQDVDFSDDGSYFVVGTNGGSGWPAAYCDALTRWETDARGSNLEATWVNFTGNDSITAVEAADGVVYVGGHFRWLNNPNRSDAKGPGGIDRLGIGAVNASTGMPVNWNPRRTAGANLPSGGVNWGPTVSVLWRGSDGLYFGQDSDGMGGEYHGRMGMFPLAGGRVVQPKNATTASTGYLYLGTANGELTKVAFDGTSLGAEQVMNQPNFTHAGAVWQATDRIFWVNNNVSGYPNGRLDASMFNGHTIGAPWEASGYNDWFNAKSLRGGFLLDGRLYYVRSGSSALHYRYFETDGGYLGATEFTVSTQGVSWSAVRGMAWVAGKIVYGATDGRLRSVPFDPTADVAVDGSEAVVLAEPTATLTWSTPTMFFADK